MIKVTILLILSSCITACSSIAFTGAGHPYDGTGHTLSTIVCSNYHATRNLSGEKKSTSGVKDTAFLFSLGVLDLIFTLPLDTIRMPFDLIRNKQEKPDWDNVNHWKIYDCKNYPMFMHLMTT